MLAANERFGRNDVADGSRDARSIRRLEDARFLTGHGRYVEDIGEPTALHGHVLRSPHAHALIRSIDVSSAASIPGVHLVATADDLAADGLGHMPCLAAVKPMIVPPRPALATGRVRHVGDPVCFVVADSAEIAREAAERIEIDYEPMPSVSHGRTALAEGAPVLWDEAPGNLAYHVQRGDHAAVAQAMKSAAHIVDVDVTNNRVIVVPLEPRAGIARYDAATDTMDLELTGQGLHGIRRQLAEFIFKVAPRAHPASCAGCRRRVRDEELPLSRMDPASVGSAAPQVPGALAGRSRRGFRDGRAGPRHRGDGTDRAR